MSRNYAPVAILRWFADGEGWAYHPDLKGDKFQWIVGAVDKQLFSSKATEEISVARNGWKLVGEKVPDNDNPVDPKVLNRSPFILRVACLHKHDAERIGNNRLLEQLRGLVLPTEKGPSETLKVSLILAGAVSSEGHAARRGHRALELPASARLSAPHSHEHEPPRLHSDINELLREKGELQAAKSDQERTINRLKRDLESANSNLDSQKKKQRIRTLAFVIAFILLIAASARIVDYSASDKAKSDTAYREQKGKLESLIKHKDEVEKQSARNKETIAEFLKQVFDEQKRSDALKKYVDTDKAGALGKLVESFVEGRPNVKVQVTELTAEANLVLAHFEIHGDNTAALALGMFFRLQDGRIIEFGPVAGSDAKGPASTPAPHFSPSRRIPGLLRNGRGEFTFGIAVASIGTSTPV